MRPVNRGGFVRTACDVQRGGRRSLGGSCAHRGKDRSCGILSATCDGDCHGGFVGRRIDLTFGTIRRGCSCAINLAMSPSRDADRGFINSAILSGLSHGIIGLSPVIHFGCGFSGHAGLHVGCHKHADRPDVARLRPITSVSSPLGAAVNGPSLGPACAGSLFVHFRGFIPSGRATLVMVLGFSCIVGSVIGGSICINGANGGVAACSGMGKGCGKGVHILFGAPLGGHGFSVGSVAVTSCTGGGNFVGRRGGAGGGLVLVRHTNVSFHSSCLSLKLGNGVHCGKARGALRKRDRLGTFGCNINKAAAVCLPLSFGIRDSVG